MIGIDVAKRELTACRWDAGEPEPRWERSYRNSPEGVRALLGAAPADQPWVLEPTGRYADLAVRLAQAEGREVRRAHTFAAKLFLRSLTPRAKTDRVDARGLAQYGLAVSLPLYTLKPEPLEWLWELLQVRCALGKALAALRQQLQALPLARPLLEPLVEFLNESLQALERTLEEAGRELPLFVRLRAIPGVGTLTAAALTVRLLQLDFPSYDAFVAYVGLDLQVCESGTRKGVRRLSRRGDAQLRWLLFLAARANLRVKQDHGFRQLYTRKREEGWCSTGAVCIVARKLAKVAWSLAHTGQHYDPARVFAARSA